MAGLDSYSIFRENRLIRWIFLALFLAVLVGLFYIFRDFMWPFLFAITLYITLVPVNDRIMKRIGNRSLSATLVVLALVILVLGPLTWMFITVGNQAYDLYMLIQDRFSTGFMDEMHRHKGMRLLLKYLNLREGELLQKILNFVQGTAMDVFSSITVIITYPISFLINFLFMILMLFYFLKEGYRIDKMIADLLPFPEEIEKNIMVRLKEVIRVLLLGNLLIMILQGFMVWLGFMMTGIGMSLLWGSVAAVLSLIPVVGTTFVWIPGALYLLFLGKITAGIFLAVWCFFWYLLLENIVKPKVFGDILRFHPLVFFFLLVGSIKTFNLPGILAGPLLLTLFYSLLEIYRMLVNYSSIKAETDREDHT